MVEVYVDESQVTPPEDFSAFPPGEYTVSVTKSDKKPMKDRPSEWLIAFEFTVLEGQYRNRKIWQNMNLGIDKNRSRDGYNMAANAFLGLCQRCGKKAADVKDTNMLHNIPFKAQVKILPAKGNYAAQNAIDLTPSRSGVTAVTTPTPAPTTSAAPATEDVAPWMKG